MKIVYFKKYFNDIESERERERKYISHGCPYMYVGQRTTLWVSSLLPTFESQGLDTGHQVWQQTPLSFFSPTYWSYFKTQMANCVTCKMYSLLLVHSYNCENWITWRCGWSSMRTSLWFIQIRNNSLGREKMTLPCVSFHVHAHGHSCASSFIQACCQVTHCTHTDAMWGTVLSTEAQTCWTGDISVAKWQSLKGKTS